MIFNDTVFDVRVWERAMYLGTDSECYCDCRESLTDCNKERN
jgi:hypothetical protein